MSEKQNLKRQIARMHKHCMRVWREWADRGYPPSSKRGVAAHNCLNVLTFAWGYTYENNLPKAREELAEAQKILRDYNLRR